MSQMSRSSEKSMSLPVSMTVIVSTIVTIVIISILCVGVIKIVR